MSKSTPSPPPQPDPKVVAAAQTGSNVTTAQSQTVLNNANQYGPYGSTEFDIAGYQPVYDPTTKQTYNIPQYNQTTTLAPAQQALLDQQNQLGGKLNNLAISQTDRIGNLLGQPISTPMGAKLVTSLDDIPQWAKDAVTQNNVAENIYSRLNPQIERDRAQLDTKLANEGFARGSEAYNQGMDEQNRAATDARVQAELASGQEQSRIFGMLAQGIGLNNQAYGQALQSDLALRNQPINEISALMNGGQVSLPQFQGYQGGSVAPTPVGDYYMQNAQVAAQNYQAQLAAQSQQTAGLYGGIGSVLGTGLYGAFKYSDRRVKRDITRIGTWFNGLPLYLFRYLWSPFFHVGFMAQDVELVMPGAVVTINGIKRVNYAMAMRT